MTKKLVWPATFLAAFALAAACGGGSTDADGMGGEGGQDGSGGGDTVGSGGSTGGQSVGGEGGLGGNGPVVVVPLTCSDGEQNESETDVDCGGPDCDPCDDDASCVEPTDCESGICTEGVCSAPECGDGIVNGAEDCDPGRETNDCDADCTFAKCGDGYVNERVEECEPDPDLGPWQRCGRTCIHGVNLDGTWRDVDRPGTDSPWEMLTWGTSGGAVPALQSFHYIGQRYIYDFYYSLRYDIAADEWGSVAELAPFFGPDWANAAVDASSLWVARGESMYRFDIETETWEQVTVDLPDGTPDYTAAVFDGDGFIWYAGEGDNLVKYDPTDGSFELVSYEANFPGFDLFEARLAYDPRSNKILAAGFQNSQFLILDLETEEFSSSLPSPYGELKDNTCQDRAGGVYVGSDSYEFMYRYDVAEDTFTELPALPVPHDNWSTCVVSEVGYLYYGTDRDYGGFARLRLNTH